ncbi:hypothetical protein DE146DRAFT_12550 [Phaeosphaeria sp. MPI-PUGE-AT-0046c]|nr:hypothetical protein DE146DRAFT_12550 [Phaeosphaeria sp. MPI-PUGE-AT-0046c]
MSSRSSHSSNSQSSKSSSASMMTAMAQSQSRPYLTLDRASTISSWQSSLPDRKPQSHLPSSMASQAGAQPHQAAVDAYQQLKLALFRRTGPSPSRPG